MTALEFWGLVLVLVSLFCWLMLFRVLGKIQADLSRLAEVLAPAKKTPPPAGASKIFHP